MSHMPPEAMVQDVECPRTTMPRWEIRYWYEPPAGSGVLPAHWAVIGYSPTRQGACIIAVALQRQRGWTVHVWNLETGMLTDIFPGRLR